MPSGDFALSSDACSGTNLAAGANCVVDVTFTPTQTGTRTGSLTISDAAASSPQTVTLSGKGYLTRPTFSPASLAFGDQQVDVTSASKTVTLTNPNSISLSVTSVVVSAGDFTLVSDMCSGTNVPAGGTCTFAVTFTPSTTGTRTGTATVTDDAITPTQPVPLSGVGFLVTPTVSPKSLPYGRVQVNNVSPPQTIALSNSNSVAVTFSSIATSGPYAITANSCGSSVPANSSCQVSVTFNPTTDSSASGTTETGKLTFTDNARVPTQTVTLTGIAFGAVASPTPTATSTGATATPTASATGTPTTTATATVSATATATATMTATATATATTTATGTATSTATATQTASSTTTATPTATVTATSTSTSTPTSTATATPTATATATSTTVASATPSATPTSTPGPEAGSILIAGGDTGGKLSGVINLATDTVSTNSAQIFNAATDTFLAVGNLNTARESAVAVALPNGLTLVVGGQTCAAATYGSVSGYQCNALQTAELYNESTKSFTVAGSGSGGMMTVARSGPSATLIQGSGTALDGQVLIVGGSTGSSFLSVTTPAAGSGAPTGQTGLNSAELYNPIADAFVPTANSIPVCPAGTTCATGLPANCPGTPSAISSTSESGTTVTITMTSANPVGLTVGDKVVIADVSVNGYDGTFAVTAIPSGTTFQYTGTSGLTAGSGGTAASDTAACGMVDQGAALIPNDGGKVLLAGGDLITFLGQSSNLAFIFDPATQTFSRTGSMATPRELFSLNAMDPAVVSGPLSGDVVAFGGIEANATVCVQTSTTPTVATTTNTAEVFNPGTQTWSATANTMGVKRAGVATLLEMGSLAGEALLPGGVDVEAGTYPSTCAIATGIKQGATAETDLYDPGTGTGGTFTATGSLNQAREGPAQGQIGVGTDVTDVLVAG